MAGSAVDGTGATVTFGTSSFTAQLLEANWTGRERGNIRSTHMGTTGSHTYIPHDLVEPGELSLKFWFNCTDNTATILGAAAETITIGWDTGKSWAGSGFCTGVEAGATIGEGMEQTLKFKMSGAVTEDIS